MNVALMETTFRAANITNFVGKVSGSNIPNPNRFARYNSKTAIENPANYPVDAGQTFINAIMYLDGATANLFTTLNGRISQDLFSFDLIQHVINKYGVGVFGFASSTADRVAWLKANVVRVTCNWWGFGSGPAGNKASFSSFNDIGNTWYSPATTTSASIVRVSNVIPTASVPTLIDTNGFIHFLAYADASDGVTASTINTDYVELIPEIIITQ